MGKTVTEQASIPTSELTCEQCRELLSDYVDRELTDAERSAVERHLGNCGKCGTESSRLVGLKKVVQHWGGVKGSGEFRKALMERVVRESQQMPALNLAEAPAGANPSAQAQTDSESGAAERTLPPIWILLVAAVVAAAAYYLVLWLRGV